MVERERDLAAQGGPSRQLHELNGTSPEIIIARNCVYKMRECHPTGGVLEGYASGAQGPVGALSEAREYEDRCVRSTALGSIPKAAWAAFPSLGRRATTTHCNGKHHDLS